MKQFFKYMFASLLGTLISLFIILFVGIVIILGIFSSAFSDLDQSQKVTKVEDDSILHIRFDQPIVDRGPEEQVNFNFGSFRSQTALGLDQIIENLEKAKEDDKIKGIYLEVDFIPAGMATTKEIRDALIDFKESGKWIVSYSEIFSQKATYLASVADEVYVYPEGAMDFRGLNAEVTFFKQMLDKLEIEPQIIRGSNNKFKSAVEPFIMDEMSQASRLQTETWLNSMWGSILTEMEESMEIPDDTLDQLAENFTLRYAEDAVDAGFANGEKYEDEVFEILKEKVGMEDDEKLNFVTLPKYFKAPASTKDNDGEFTFSYKKDKIAVVYASGAIGLGEGQDDAIGSDTYVKAIKSAREDSTVKAIVLRVNSPGGVALAGDMIWREVDLASEAKPVVVSMGDVAASAGYYISAPADKIFASPNTITGSIGVFGIVPNMKGFFNDKIGMTFDNVETNDFADFGGVTRPLTDGEMRILQKSVDRTYADFLGKVSAGRDLSVELVDSIGQGRVWTGTDALEIGLVDELGGLQDAIEEAARLAEIEDYTLRNLPKREDPFEKLLKDLNMAMVRNAIGFNAEDAELIKQYKKIQEIKGLQGIQARLPYEFTVE